jgi:glycosyltransferase involved in cell wall biosynthesis
MSLAIVIPCFKVEKHIEVVIKSIPDSVDFIIAVDDFSPDNTSYILKSIAKKNSRLYYIRHEVNKGVGGAMITGFNKAFELGAEIIVKIDGDGQMNLNYLPQFIEPILSNKADLTKGNRFKNYKALKSMPIFRRIGNLGLSFLLKAASGYWNIFDPTNGFFAISAVKLKDFDLTRIHNRYFFESSLLIEAYHNETVIVDIPIDSFYGNEVSNLSITKVFLEFPPKLLKAFLRRIILKYFLNDFNIASLFIVVGIFFGTLGSWYGISNFIYFSKINQGAPTGTVVIPTLLITLGTQLILSAIQFDINNYPKK